MPADTVLRGYLLMLQVRAANDSPVVNTLVNLVATSGVIRDTARSDAEGFVSVNWRGLVPQDPVVITASASFGGSTVRRQIRLARREAAAAPAYIREIAPERGHSAFAGRFLKDDIEVQIQADGRTCNRTKVTFEYLNAGTSSAPAPVRHSAPALWSEMDDEEFGCTAQLRWVLSPTAGDQTLRAWIERDTSFTVPSDDAGAQQYLRPRVVRAVAHAPPAFLAGAAISDSSGSRIVPKLVGIGLSFPTLADLLKHRKGLESLGGLVDRTRFLLATEFGSGVGSTVYVGIEPLVLLVGPRAADVPVALAVGERFGPGRNRFFVAGLVNAGNLAGIVAAGLGIK